MMKLIFSKFRITTKRDWVIFWIFAVLLANALATWSQRLVDRGLHKFFGSPWLRSVDEPEGYGRLITMVVILAIVAVIVCFLRHETGRVKLVVFSAGIVVSLALMGMYWINCRLIMSVIKEDEPQYMHVDWQEFDQIYSSQRYLLTKEEQSEVLELIRNMTMVSDEQKVREYLEWNFDRGETWGQTEISVYFGERYGEHIWVTLDIWEDTILIDRQMGSTELVTIFEDNGLIQYIENIGQEQIGAAQ